MGCCPPLNDKALTLYNRILRFSVGNKYQWGKKGYVISSWVNERVNWSGETFLDQNAKMANFGRFEPMGK